MPQRDRLSCAPARASSLKAWSCAPRRAGDSRSQLRGLGLASQAPHGVQDSDQVVVAGGRAALAEASELRRGARRAHPSPAARAAPRAWRAATDRRAASRRLVRSRSPAGATRAAGNSGASASARAPAPPTAAVARGLAQERTALSSSPPFLLCCGRLDQLPQPARAQRDLAGSPARASPSASSSACAKSAPTGMAPASPAPLVPSALSGEGVSSWPDLDARHVERGGQQEVHERGVEELARSRRRPAARRRRCRAPAPRRRGPGLRRSAG